MKVTLPKSSYPLVKLVTEIPGYEDIVTCVCAKEHHAVEIALPDGVDESCVRVSMTSLTASKQVGDGPICIKEPVAKDTETVVEDSDACEDADDAIKATMKELDADVEEALSEIENDIDDVLNDL